MYSVDIKGSRIDLVLFKQDRSLHGIDTSVFLVSCGNIVKLVCIVGLHQLHRLLQLVKILAKDGYMQAVHKLCQILNILRQCCYSVGVDLLHIGGQRLCLNGQSVRL